MHSTLTIVAFLIGLTALMLNQQGATDLSSILIVVGSIFTSFVVIFGFVMSAFRYLVRPSNSHRLVIDSQVGEL